MSLFSLFYEATLFVKMIIITLVGLSLLSWSIIFTKLSSLKQHEQSYEKFMKVFFSGKYGASDIAAELKSRKGGPIGVQRVFLVGHKARNEAAKGRVKGDKFSYIEESIDSDISKIDSIISKNLNKLATIASSSPYIGLLGTVLGIMNSFIGLAGAKQATLEQVAPGIAEALFATGIGLLVAIPASIAYNVLVTRKEEILDRYEGFKMDYLLSLRKDCTSEKH